MRKIIAATFVSLDGVMQAPGGPEEDPVGGFKFGGWTFHYFDEVAGTSMEELFSKPFALLLGRRTYDIFAAYWPYQKDPIADVFNPATKYVFGDGATPAAFRLTKSRTSTTGVIMATYERAGEIQVGSFATQEPSEAELERRRNWK